MELTCFAMAVHPSRSRGGDPLGGGLLLRPHLGGVVEHGGVGRGGTGCGFPHDGRGFGGARSHDGGPALVAAARDPGGYLTT